MTEPPDEPENHREIDERSRRTTKAYACTCAAHQKPHCSFFRMGYCTNGHSFVPTPRKPALVIDNGNVYTVDFKRKNT
jgi:hypothetical protein